MASRAPGRRGTARAALERVLAWVRDGFAPADGAPALVVSTPAGQAHRLAASRGELARLSPGGAAGEDGVPRGEEGEGRRRERRGSPTAG